MKNDAALPEPVPPQLPVTALPPDALAEISVLALRLQRANGPVMRALNAFGGRIEARMTGLPENLRRLIETGMVEILAGAYEVAGRVGAHRALPDTGNWGHRAAVATGGALGGVGGLGTALVELPATIALFFGAMQKVAGQYGFDPASAETRAVCIEVFGAGGPLAEDDGVNTSFLGTRLAVNGRAVQALIQQVAPTLAAVIGRKLATQAVPVIGAAAGAGLNLAFLSYYQEMAHVRFGLKRLADRYGAAPVDTAFREDVRRLRAG
ncbi:EcsC family protein [Defluviimonas sp. WL0024]|uniref:EcsC family protein n=2 Tax=Albidovulum TaxID=205889 RepID=A0ABT3J005_9RHOB|nr:MULTISPECIES: EcsC family protein [Defluviimonas]MCU9847205.1 EcsC family protein [Defluviimonas sp. WL0024]MCW3781005.1 EcsC family protein [Defluviimonas salinarum]